MLQTRRDILKSSAAATAAAGLLASGVALPHPTEGGELATLIARYFTEVDAFNAAPGEDDAAFEAKASSTYEATLHKMIGMPVHTPGDAVAAIDWILRDGEDCLIDFNYGPYGAAAASLLKEVKIYLAGGAS